MTVFTLAMCVGVSFFLGVVMVMVMVSVVGVDNDLDLYTVITKAKSGLAVSLKVSFSRKEVKNSLHLALMRVAARV
ncbi:hypothetical protein RRF57_006062 [Xylaria bambusicola]|uniref:Uncharacterized protein n=1 Tax=Xylaria bambusicola TaxID=326684 RepID=A0AAN7Z5A4_9PEZI